MAWTADSSGVVVGVDGSEYSDAAVRWAVRAAAMRDEPVTLIAVAERHAPLATYDTGKRQRSRQAQHDDGDRILAAAQQVAEEVLAGDSSNRLRTEFMFAHPLATLIERSKEARMVVVGCRGRNALERLTLGSVSSGLVRYAHCPVAVIHNEQAEPGLNAPILLGIDGSPASEFATAIAFDEASNRHAPLTAMHAWADSLISGAHLNWTIDEQKGTEVLRERLQGWQDTYPDVRVTPTLIRQDAGRWLVNHSDTAQLVVVGSHGRGGFAGMMLGSVSATVVHAAEVPVIVARRP